MRPFHVTDEPYGPPSTLAPTPNKISLGPKPQWTKKKKKTPNTSDAVREAATPTIRNQPAASTAIDPATLMEERDAAKKKNKTMAESVLEANALVPAGTTRIGRAFKAGFTGAAVGATLGEALSNYFEKKAQTGTPQPARTLSEKAVESHAPPDQRDPSVLKATHGESTGRKPRQKRDNESESTYA